MPTLRYASGWEHGILDTGGGAMLVAAFPNCTIATDFVNTGARSLRINTTADTGYWEKGSVGETPTVIVARFYLYFVTLPDVDSLFFNDDTATAALGVGYDVSEGKFACYANGLTTAGGPTIVTDTWYRIDCKIDASAVTADAQIDGTDLTQATDAVASGTFNAYKIGPNAQTPTMDVRVDDFVASHVGADYPIGEGSVIALSPNGVGTHNLDTSPSNAFLKDIGGTETALDSSETTSWEVLDDVPLNADENHIVLQNDAGLAATDYIEYTFADSSETGDIQAVQAIVVIRQDTAANCDITAKLREGGSESNIYTGDINGTGRDYRVTCFATKPSGGDWTDSALDGSTLRFGYTTDADGRIRFDSAMFEVAYAAAAGPAKQSSYYSRMRTWR